MWTEAGPLRAMRAAARAALPPRAFLKRDRGSALFITNAPVFDPALSTVPGFRAERQGALLRLTPDESWIQRLERRRTDPPDHLSLSLMRFRGRDVPPENLMLFVQGAKLADAGSAATPAEAAAYSRALRQRAAAALRLGSGGGLYAAAILNAMIEKNIKENMP